MNQKSTKKGELGGNKQVKKGGVFPYTMEIRLMEFRDWKSEKEIKGSYMEED